MKIKLIIPIAMVLITSQALAQFDPEKVGQRTHRHAERMLNHLDEDGDNLISIEEFKSPPGARFSRMELGEDGITLDELQRRFEEKQQEHATRAERWQQKMLDHFTEMDTDGDGNVTPDEIKLARFNRMDKNNDGYISADEIKSKKRKGRSKPGFRQRDRSHQDGS